jgi:replicative DNA helicase
MIPFSEPNCETVLLASMMQHPEAYFQAVALGLRPEHFTIEQNRLVARAMYQLTESGQPVSFESLLKQITSSPTGEKIVAVLEDVTNPLHVPRKDVEWLVKQLQDAARRTRFVSVCERGVSAAHDKTQNTNECIETAQESLLELQGEAIAPQAGKVRDLMPQLLRDLQDRAKQKGLIGLPTGITELDEATTGIRPGELWVIGAMSGRGKTALGTQIALANTAQGNPVVFFSLEMTRNELGDRLLCNESSVSASRIRNPSFIDPDQWREIANTAGKLAEWPLFIDDSPSRSPECEAGTDSGPTNGGRAATPPF